MIFVKVLSILLLFVVISHLGSCKSKDDCQCACACSPKIHVRLANPATPLLPVPPSTPAATTPSSAPTTSVSTTTEAMTTTPGCIKADFEQDARCPTGQRIYDSLGICIKVLEPVAFADIKCIGYLMLVTAEAHVTVVGDFVTDECTESMWVNGIYDSTDNRWEDIDEVQNTYLDSVLFQGAGNIGKCALYDANQEKLVVAPCTEEHLPACVEDKME